MVPVFRPVSKLRSPARAAFGALLASERHGVSEVPSGRRHTLGMALLHWRAVRRSLPPSIWAPVEPVHKTGFSRRTGFKHEALPLADHAHDLEAFDRRRRVVLNPAKKRGVIDGNAALAHHLFEGAADGEIDVPSPSCLAMSDFKGRRFPTDIILICVRWYCKYGISYRDQ